MLGGPEKLSGLLRQIHENGGGIEYPDFLAVGSIRIDDGRNLAVRIDGAKGRRVLLTLFRVNRNGLVGQLRYFQAECHFCRVRGGMEIEPDHLFSFRW